jgi:outer membrane lipase/esterase
MKFRQCLRFAAALVPIALGSAAAHAAASPYDKIVVFGDSYNDVGNIYAAAAQYHIVYPPPPYYEGRFSNGPLWIEHVASDWGLPMLPSALGGTDFATGGAYLLQPVLDQGLPIPSVEQQVALYLALNGGHADPKALYVIEGGGNDILGATDFAPGQLACAIAQGLYGIEKTLRLAGGKSFLIPELIDVGHFPGAVAAGPAFSAFATATSLKADEELANLLIPDEKLPGVNIFVVQTYHTLVAVANTPGHFGFANIDSPCLLTSGLSVVSECADPTRTLYWDDEHLTEFGQAFFAVLVEGAVYNH